MLYFFLLAFLVSFLVSIALIRLSYQYKKLLTDSLHEGPQKFHQLPAPRLGGIALFLALLSGVILANLREEVFFKKEYTLLFIVGLPAFLAGLMEDLTGRLGVKMRLLLIALSAGMAFLILAAKISRLDLPYLDLILANTLLSFFFTLFAITGVTNSINIIDGFNGLASMVGIIILLSLSFVGYKLGDYFLVTFAVTLVGALVGFFLLNYPAGFIFLGDGGAYLTGFFIAELSVLLVARHPEVSPWFPFLACIYPIFETLFSIYRRKFLKGVSPGLPDALHLHSIIFKIITKWLLGPMADKTLRNALTSPFLWALTMLSVIPALIFWDRTYILLFFSLLFMFFYVYFYWKLIYLKMPKSLRRRGKAF